MLQLQAAASVRLPCKLAAEQACVAAYLAACAAASGAPVVKVTAINKAMLASQAPRIQLELPNVRSPITVNIRRDLSTAPEPSGSAAARAASAASAGFDEVTSPGVFVGEVAGARGALSSVVLVTAESGAVYGDITFYDARTKSTRSFKVRSCVRVTTARTHYAHAWRRTDHAS